MASFSNFQGLSSYFHWVINFKNIIQKLTNKQLTLYYVSYQIEKLRYKIRQVIKIITKFTYSFYNNKINQWKFNIYYQSKAQTSISMI